MENNYEIIVIPEIDKDIKTILSILKELKISPELKRLCFRLYKNTYIKKLVDNAPINTLLEVCEEYKKYPDLYDEIFSGRVHFFLDGARKQTKPLFSPSGIKTDSHLKMFFGTNTLTGEIIEKFVTCTVENTEIKRVTIKLKEDKILTAGFNTENRMVSMIVDFLSPKHENDIILNFLNFKKKHRMDLIRI